MATPREEFVGLLRRHRVMAIVRGDSEAAALATGRALLEEGIALVEVTLTTPGALDVIARLRQERPTGTLVGAGTVLTGLAKRIARDARAFAVGTPADVEAFGERLAG